MQARSRPSPRALALAAGLAPLAVAAALSGACTVPDYTYDNGAYSRARGLAGGTGGGQDPGPGGSPAGGAGGGGAGGAGGHGASGGGAGSGGASPTGASGGGHGANGGSSSAGATSASGGAGGGGQGGAAGGSGGSISGGGGASGADAGGSPQGTGGAPLAAGGNSGTGGDGAAAGGAGAGGAGAGGMATGGAGMGGAGMAGAGMAGAGMAGAGGTTPVEPPLGCVLKSFDFSGCPADFTPTGNKSSWQCGAPTGGEGPAGDHTTGAGALWATNPSGDSNDCEDSWLASPVFDLSAQVGKTVILRVWSWLSMRSCNPNGFGCGFACSVDSSSYSGGVVEVDADGTGNWQSVTPTEGYQNNGQSITCGDGVSMSMMMGGCALCAINGQPGFTARSPQKVWLLSSFDVSAFATAGFRFRLHFGSEDSFPCFPDTGGWYVDDIELGLSGACH